MTQPTWSPDSQRLAFGTFDGHMRINSVGHDGSDLVEVVDLGDQGHVLFNVSWSPDGSEILYVNDGQVYLVGANGDDVKVLTQKASSQYHAAWSPDGSRIAVHDGAEMTSDGWNIQPDVRIDVALFTMARDGSDVRVLVRDKRIRLEGSPPRVTELVFIGDLEDLTGIILPELGNLSELRYLVLIGNRLGDSIPPELGRLQNLEYLSLAHNRLTGEVPPELSSLGSLRKLELSQDRLEGSIPSELGRLSKLEVLDLSGNRLGGNIPAELGNLDNLKGVEAVT